MDIVNNAIQLEGENVPLVNSNIYDNSSELNSTKRKLSTDITDILKDSKIPNLETENVELILNGVDDKVLVDSMNGELSLSNDFSGNILSNAIQLSNILTPDLHYESQHVGEPNDPLADYPSRAHVISQVTLQAELSASDPSRAESLLNGQIITRGQVIQESQLSVGNPAFFQAKVISQGRVQPAKSTVPSQGQFISQGQIPRQSLIGQGRVIAQVPRMSPLTVQAQVISQGQSARHSPIPTQSLLATRVISQGQASRDPVKPQISGQRVHRPVGGKLVNSGPLSVGQMLPLGAVINAPSRLVGTMKHSQLLNQNGAQILNFNGVSGQLVQTPGGHLVHGGGGGGGVELIQSSKVTTSGAQIVDSSGQAVQVLPGSKALGSLKPPPSSSAGSVLRPAQSLLHSGQLAPRNFHGQPGALPSDPKTTGGASAVVMATSDVSSAIPVMMPKPVVKVVMSPQVPSTISTTTISKSSAHKVVSGNNVARLNANNYHQVTMNNGKFQYIRLFPNTNGGPPITTGKKITPKYIQPQQPKNTKTHSSQPRFILPVTTVTSVGNGSTQILNPPIVQASNEQVLNPSGQNITQFMLNRSVNTNLSSGVSLIQGVPPIGQTQIVVSPADSKTSVVCKEESKKSTYSTSSNASSRETKDSKGSTPRQRKPCNCNKSQCLKLYCDCFANGEFCQNCNCTNCANNLDNEDSRSRAIKNCLERNPLAFHPKIGKGRGSTTDRRHTKGCNCKRSGCLKNYCECYEAKIMCTSMCKCFGCKNISPDDVCNSLMHLADAAVVRDRQAAQTKSRIAKTSLNLSNIISSMKDKLKEEQDCEMLKQPYSFVNSEVAIAASNCLLARGEEMERLHPGNTALHEQVILEEFERCIKQLINSAVVE